MAVVELDTVRLLAEVRRQPWRAVLAAAARRAPDRVAAVSTPGAAAALALLPVRDDQRALVVDDPWGEVAVPLARRLSVTALLASAPLAALAACVAAQEGVALHACAGALDRPPFAAGRFDLVWLRGELAAAPALHQAGALLAPAGTLYATATNAFGGGRLQAETPGAPLTLAELRARIAAAGLAVARAYACFPDGARPRTMVPLRLVADVLRTRPGGDAALARTGVAEHLVPAFAFVLRRA